MSTKFYVHIKNHAVLLDQACERKSDSPVFHSNWPWTAARSVLEEQGKTRIYTRIYFTPTGDKPLVKYEAELVDIHDTRELTQQEKKSLLNKRVRLAQGESTDFMSFYEIRQCRRLEEPGFYHTYLKKRDGTPISSKLGYAIPVVCTLEQDVPTPRRVRPGRHRR